MANMTVANTTTDVAQVDTAQLAGTDLPVPVLIDPAPAADLLAHTAELITSEGGETFPSFGGPAIGYYTRDLEGQPFVFSSEVVLRLQPARKLDDGRVMPAQEVAQAWVRMLDEQWLPLPSQLATLGGRYLVNQLRNASRDMLIHGGIFTVARNPRFTALNGQHPYMLKRYELDDAPPPGIDDGGPFGQPSVAPIAPMTPVTTATQNVRARIAEIEAAGVVPSNYWNDLPGIVPVDQHLAKPAMTRQEFITGAAHLGYNINQAMKTLGVRSLQGLNLDLALAQLHDAHTAAIRKGATG